MTERSLVVHQGALSDIEEAMTTASKAIHEHVTALLDRVNTTTPAWTDETPSRIAQQDYERRLREGLTRLTEALDEVKTAVATYREDAREIEVENVAIVH
jgi:predicted RNase H-like HicB family nuclease